MIVIVVVSVLIVFIVVALVVPMVLLSWWLARPRIPQIVPLLCAEFHLRMESNPRSYGAITGGVHSNVEFDLVSLQERLLDCCKVQDCVQTTKNTAL